MRFPNRSTIRTLIGGLAVALAFAGIISLLPSPKAQVDTKTAKTPPAYQARVIAVSDGDSLTVRANDKSIKIRLAQIDAPEHGQPWGQKSRAVLTELVAGKTVTVIGQGQDRYGRTIGDVTVDGRDINQIMVARGAAWAYSDYVRDQAIVNLEANARATGQGLWAMSEDQRLPPWEYRAQQRRDTSVMVGR